MVWEYLCCYCLFVYVNVQRSVFLTALLNRSSKKVEKFVFSTSSGVVKTLITRIADRTLINRLRVSCSDF